MKKQLISLLGLAAAMSLMLPGCSSDQQQAQGSRSSAESSGLTESGETSTGSEEVKANSGGSTTFPGTLKSIRQACQASVTGAFATAITSVTKDPEVNNQVIGSDACVSSSADSFPDGGTSGAKVILSGSVFADNADWPRTWQQYVARLDESLQQMRDLGLSDDDIAGSYGDPKRLDVGGWTYGVTTFLASDSVSASTPQRVAEINLYLTTSSGAILRCQMTGWKIATASSFTEACNSLRNAIYSE